ncbi:MAG: ThiF family adenylyltransferase [Actinomycetota bacterium]|nr:ThiF family adenylyltransferase [Actinomycetota bacterium]MDK1016655.1 ThiF family adenylyltransferase [Actinomycetota bacterium]MDK1026548.1 ThiF family adenylyltransferase [Actinomycetota bacterium]MDK1038903.1 ThiF family adenylyltransferase [Actinomycetota bacterium]MDK1097102.1 ThiF family adenylyltransferase [Actinomycetota bacterium]
MTDRQPEVTATEAHAASFPLIFDIRSHASSTPTLPRATIVSTDDLINHPARFVGSVDDPVLIICDIGVRSRVVTDQLRTMGYGGAVSLEGGIESWTAAGFPTVAPEGLTADAFRRYDRQIKLPGLGVPGQQALMAARVAVVGAGGLGAPVLAYLAGAGVGHLTIIDSDSVEVSNLHRQPIFRSDEVGVSKAAAAAAFVSALNPDISAEPQAVRLSAESAVDLLEGHDIVVTSTDSLEATRAINAAAVNLRIPMVFGSVYRFEGQIAVLDARDGPCYDCVFPAGVDEGALDCSIVGVLGSVTGVVGAMQATEVIKLITGIGETSSGRLALYDARTRSLDSLRIRKNAACDTCG